MQLLPMAALGLLLNLSSAPPDSLTRVSREAWVMGTRITVTVHAIDRARGLQIAERAISEVERVERLLSTWDPDSDLSGVNRSPVGVRVRPDAEVGAWLIAAADIARDTQHAFTPAVGALIDAWDLRGAGREPSAEERAIAVRASGPEAVVVDRSGAVVRHRAEAWIDAGAFGKGAALAAVALRLRHVDTPITVDLGGQIWSSGTRCLTPIGVAHPSARTRSVRALSVEGVSIATSGASERGIEVGGERRGHIVDPRTGVPVPAWGSVSVVSADPLSADALATALFVMGPDLGPAWATERGVAALFLAHTEDDIAERFTPAMKPYLQSTEAICP